VPCCDRAAHGASVLRLGPGRGRRPAPAVERVRGGVGERSS
jgi:hypothetical protein